MDRTMKLGLVLSGVIGLALCYIGVFLLVELIPSLPEDVHTNLYMFCVFMVLCSFTGAVGFFALIVDKLKGE